MSAADGQRFVWVLEDFEYDAQKLVVGRIIKHDVSDEERDEHGRFSSGGSLSDVKSALEKGTTAFEHDGGEIHAVSIDEANEAAMQLSDQRSMIEQYQPIDGMDARGYDFTEFALRSAGEESMHSFIATVDGMGIAGAMSVQERDDTEYGVGKYLFVDYVGTTQIASGTGTSLANAAYEYAAARGLGVQGEPYKEAATFWEKLGWVEDPEGVGGAYFGLTADQVKELVSK